MKKINSFLLSLLSVFLGISLLAFIAVKENPEEELPIGSKAPLTDVEMVDVSGKTLTLEEVAQENGLLVIFSCNTCPWVHSWEGRYLTISELADEKGVGMIALNPNEAWRDGEESLETMKKRAAEQGYTFPYAVDKNHRLADAYGAAHTPHVYLFDKNMTLVYRGAIDDNGRSPERVENHYLRDAIVAMTSGQEIPRKTSKSLGCTIKRIK